MKVFPLLVLLVHDVAGIHAIESVSSVVSPTVTSVHALVFNHALAGTHALACVSEVVGSSVAGVVALCMLQHDVLAVAFFPVPMPEKSSGLFGSVEGSLLHSPMPGNSGPWS